MIYCTVLYIKGTVSRDFRPSVFSSINPSWALIHRLKHFAYGFEFEKKFDSEIAKIGLRGVNEIAEADFFSGVAL
jgi:hypothetical protein